MSKSALVTRTWSGGVSVDAKLGSDNSFKASQGINHRKKASSIELHRKFVKESGTTVDTAVHQGVRAPDGSVFFMGETKIYRRTKDTVGAPGSYSVFQSGLTNIKSGAFNLDRKEIFVPSDKTIHAIKYATGSPVFQADMVGQLKDKETINTGALTYTIPLAITEVATAKIEFQPDIEPYIRVGFYVVAKGTGNITLTLHDAANAVLGTVVVAAASLTNGAVNYFTFSSQIRLSAQPNPYTYHVHLNSTVADTTIRTSVASDMSKADFVTYADALISGVYHPSTNFLQFFLVGNGNYVAAWEPITDSPTKTEYLPHRLKLPTEYTVLGFQDYKEYQVISAYKSVSSDYGTEFGVGSTEGLLGFWDGASRGFAWFVKIEGGAMESIYVKDGFIYGYVNGVLHVTSGDTPVPVYEIPGLVDFTSTHGHADDVYLQAPYNAMTVKDNVMLMAYPAVTANEAIIPGVYSFGRKTKDFAESIAFDHIPSHGQTATQFVANTPSSGITFIGTFGKNTFIGWKTVIAGIVTYGIDVLNSLSPPYASGFIEYLDMDNKMTYKEKEGVRAIATYTSLPDDAQVKLFYKINGSTTRVYGDAEAIDHDTAKKQISLTIPESYRVMSYGVELIASTGGSPKSPVVDSTTIIIEKNEQEGL